MNVPPHLPRQTQVQHKTLENLLRRLQCHACLRPYRLENPMHAWRTQSAALKLLANTQISKTT